MHAEFLQSFSPLKGVIWCDFYFLFSLVCYVAVRDVTINREPVENRLKHVTIQTVEIESRIQLGVGVYINVSLRGKYCI